MSVKGTGPLEAAVIHIQFAVQHDESDASQRDELAYRLVQELRDFGVDSVDRGRVGKRPAGVKGGPAIDFSELIVSLSPMLVANLIRLLQNWVRRADQRGLRITTAEGTTIEISGGNDWSQEDLERIAARILQAGREH